MTDALSVLEKSISEAGYWRWWTEELPSLFVAEFGGVELWSPPTAIDRPPPGIVGLGFMNPSLVAFISSDTADQLPSNWAAALHNDEIEPFGFFFEEIFTLQNPQLLSAAIEGCSLEYLVGSEANLNQASGALLIFRAGPVGLIVHGEQMAVQPFGEFEEIIRAREAWLQYWAEYWVRRDTEAPMPKDYTCEIRIPSERYRFHDS